MKTATLAIVTIIACVSFCVTMCDSFNNETARPTIVHSSGRAFAGSESCKTCHADIYASHLRTAHYKTSAMADTNNVLGSFKPGKNEYWYTSYLHVEMQKRGDSLFQVAFVDGDLALQEPINLVIGSGQKGQTFLYWNEKRLFQLPVSYYTPLNNWCNSPGYPGNQVLFNREVPIRCLECHGTYAKAATSAAGTEYDKNQMMLGVDCESCHGPAAEHVNFHSKNPASKLAKYIVNPALLNRKQKLDNCALCHSGLRNNTRPSFSFLVGDTLDNFSSTDYPADSAASLDVHGNQYGLLLASKCFRNSNSLDCSSCHNTHRKENDLTAFSQKCMTCHEPGHKNFCSLPDTAGSGMLNNCVDCHMPALPSDKIFMQVGNSSSLTHDLIRTHRIAIYPSASEKFLARKARPKVLTP